jgi:hypothetical protein
MSQTPEDESKLEYTIDYAQQGSAEDQASFTVFNEKLSKLPGNTPLFDRSAPDRFPMTGALPLETDRSIFSAVRLSFARNGGKDVDPLVGYAAQQISRFNKFRLDPAVLGSPSRLPELANDAQPTSTPRIGYHGEDLASTLYHLSETDNPVIETIAERVKEVVPEFEGFEFSTVGTDRIAFSVHYSDRRDVVPSARLSSGTLMYIGLIALVTTPNRPPVLMVEEPENGLTPQAIKSFYKAVHELAFHKSPERRSQVLISSHSPFVICEAWNGEDRDFIHQMKVSDGRATVRKFSEVIDEESIHLGKEDGKRSHLSLKCAEEVMSGRFA